MFQGEFVFDVSIILIMVVYIAFIVDGSMSLIIFVKTVAGISYSLKLQLIYLLW